MLEQLAHLDGVPWSLKHTILVDMGGIALRFIPPKDTPKPDQAAQRILEDRNNIPPFIKTFCRRQGRLLNWCGKIPWDLWEHHVELASKMENSPQGPAISESRAESQAKSAFSEADVAALAGNIWILDSKQFAIARFRGIITQMPNIKEEAIDDKSKSDGLVKIIAVLQVLWLVVQLIVRTIEDLHFTQLEITTVAFAATAVIIYSIDFIKPKDVNVPFYIDVEKVVEYDDFVAIAEAAPFAYMQGKRYYMPTSTLHDIIDYRHEDVFSDPKCRKKPDFENNSQESNRLLSNAQDGNTQEGNAQEHNSQEVGSQNENDQKKTCPNGTECNICLQWKIFIDSSRSKNDRCCWRNPYKLSPSAADIFSLMIGFASATSFGGVHLFAWNSDFPTDVERLLWQISALMTIVLPYIYIGTHIRYIGYTVADIRQKKKTLMNIVLGCIAICYISCRLFLVTGSFRALYFLPSEAFKATPAVMSIPHLG
ncbi:hypothetical protein T069G_04570 [Trichoderma breve]|uniref:Uncharacterized protein n=1 Tax=Trichoderma breve TaxID=2034170 RepID=A0A9W9E7N7_9HYPO|nr:hypothetical protein T069G_04570 [Trichoderma breve]KAJ4859582.1 hypothetical protein T069G_04570 [Trichoderma breve]